MNEVKYCPKCGSMTTILDSRTKGDGIWRRRECTNAECKYKIHTMERIYDEDRENKDTAFLDALAEWLIRKGIGYGARADSKNP